MMILRFVERGPVAGEHVAREQVSRPVGTGRVGAGGPPREAFALAYKALIVAVLLAAAGPASALVDLQGTCDQATGTFTFTVVVINDLVDGDTTGYAIVLEQTLAGSCDKPSLAALPPLALPAWQQEAVYEVSTGSPWPERTWLYRAALRHPDGELELLGPFGDVTPIVSLAWGRSPAVRGVLEADATGSRFHIVPCEQDCGQWLCYQDLDLTRIHPSLYEPHIRSGEAVDIYGDLLANVPEGGACLYATSVEPARGDPCAAVPVEAMSWGAVKSTYR